MSHWRTTIARVRALLHHLARTGRLLLQGVMWIEARLRAGLRRVAALLISALLVLWLLLWRTVRALAARLATSPRTPAWLRAPLVAFQAHRFQRDWERLALWWGDWSHEVLRAVVTPFRRSWIALTGRYGKRQVQRVAIVALLIITLLCGPLSVLGTLHIISSFGQSGQGTPHHFDPHNGTQSTIHLPPPPKVPAFTPKSARPPMSHGTNPSMQPGQLPLDPAKDTQFVGSDGRLEVDAPAGAVSAADVTAAAGSSIALRLSEMAPASGSSAGGSGVISLGSYLAEVVDGKGNRLVHGLRKPVTIKLHYSAKEEALTLDQTFVVFNGTHPKTVTGLGPYSTQKVTHDRTHHVLVAQIPADPTLSASSSTASSTASNTSNGLLGGLLGTLHRALPFSSSTQAAQQNSNLWGFTFNTYAPVAKFGSPDPLNVDLTSGSLTEGVQLDVPPGPAGAMPNITLAYNSGAVSEQHSPQGAAGWVGEGWSLSLGQISWAEHDVTINCTGCSQTWQNSWELTDPFGTSTELIPPVVTTSTYYDDTPNWYCATGNAAAVPCPIQFHTARESYARVYAYRGPLELGGTTQFWPCWRVYLANGVMEEFGCTADSVQYYPIFKNALPGGNNIDYLYIANWNLDLITNPQGDQVHVTYQSDTQTVTDPLTGASRTYPRDTIMSTVEWDSPTCVSASQLCTGTSAPTLWQPHYRVSFGASHHTVARLTNTPSGCNTDASVRCDDPTSPSGGVVAPLVNGTFVLNDAYVQTNTTSGGSYNPSSWNTVRDYALSYEQNGPTTITDPVTGKQLSAAGYLDLTKLQVVGDDGSTASPPTSFGYTSQTEYYEDGTFTPYSTTAPGACGPSWNTGGNGGSCDLWSQSYSGNSRYLTTISNGTGLQQSLSWFNGRNNTHGVNSPGSPATPAYCNGREGQGYPCNEADDQQWSRIGVSERDDSVVQLTQNGQGGAQTSLTVTSRFVYTYQLTYPLAAQECTDCVAGMYWGNQSSGDYLDYYMPQFMGYSQTSVSKPDGSVETHKFNSTEGWGVYDTSKVTCYSNLPPQPNPIACHNAPWWDLTNTGHGLETEAWFYATDGTTLLKHTTASYTAVCPPHGVTGSSGTYWDSERVSEINASNPVAVCDVQLQQRVSETKEGSSNTVSDTEAYTYDGDGANYGRVTQITSTSSSGGGSGGSASPTSIIHKASYVWNDGLIVPTADRANTNQEGGWGGIYLIDVPAFADTEDGSGNRTSCHYTNYDGLAYTTGQTSGLTQANVTEDDSYTSCGTAPSYTPSGKVAATATYDNLGNPLTAKDPDANNGDTTHLGATGTQCANVTTCAQYGDFTQAKPTLSGTVFNQNSTASYATDASGGFGLWSTSATDENNQTTTTTYDALGRVTSTKLPGETAAWTTSTSYTTWCSGTSAQSPCVEVDQMQRVDSSHTVTTRTFSDGAGRAVETRTSAPGGQDRVQYTLYNAAGEATTTSIAYFVTTYTGGPGSTAFSIPDSSQVVTTSTYDGLGRTLSVTDPLSNVTQEAYSVVCNAPGTSDTSCYEQVLATDANSHRHAVLADGFGRTIYDQRDSGNSPGTYAVYGTVKNTYDYNGSLTQVLHPNGSSTTTYSYDAAGRLTAMSDPDRGSETYSYDANGNHTQMQDARGQNTYVGYDGLNRPLWHNTANSATNAYATWSYDSTAGGNNGVGRLTGETFNGGPGSSNLGAGSYSYTYDTRGQQTASTVNLGGTNYTFSTAYNDAGQPSSLTYSDNEVVSYGYDGASGWLTSLITTPSGGSATNLLTGIAYSGTAGAAGKPTGASVAGGTYTYSASYDLDLRLSSLSLVNASTSTTLFSSSRGYDAVGNVTSVNTTLAAGTDNQVFCYDDQDGLVWAGSTGTPSCGSSLTSGTLTSAQYTQTFTYDVMDRLTSGPLGSYTYGSSAHLHAATAIGTNSYTASYDASGNMTCRAPTGSQTCAGTPTGQVLTYDNEGRLTAWQNAPSNPTSSEQMAYDGVGNRVALVVNGGTPTYFLGSLEEVAGGTLTKYFAAAGLPTAERVGTTLSYLAADGLGSVSEALDGGGNVTFQQLFAPFGGGRYSSGTSPTTRGFTGQRQDSASGLDYYNARYYDPTAGQFASADTVVDGVTGLNRYAYVTQNPESSTDPSGHRRHWHHRGHHRGHHRSSAHASPRTSKRRSVRAIMRTMTTTIPQCPGRCPGPPSCDDLCQQIDAQFSNQNSQWVLEMLRRSGTGLEFLAFILQAAQRFGGDNFIRWVGNPFCGGAACADYLRDGHIEMQTSFFMLDGSLSEKLVQAAGTLVHEATESFFHIVYHVWGVSQHFDYVAQWFGGKVTDELNHLPDIMGTQYEAPVPDVWTLHQTFGQWRAQEGQLYTDELTDQQEIPFILLGELLYSLPGGRGSWSNGMGLTYDMLLSGCVESFYCSFSPPISPPNFV